jgi:hypothetical protein
MEIDKLKSEVIIYRDKLKEKKGKVCTFGKNGPVGLSLIDAIVETLEAQHHCSVFFCWMAI